MASGARAAATMSTDEFISAPSVASYLTATRQLEGSLIEVGFAVADRGDSSDNADRACRTHILPVHTAIVGTYEVYVGFTDSRPSRRTVRTDRHRGDRRPLHVTTHRLGLPCAAERRTAREIRWTRHLTRPAVRRWRPREITVSADCPGVVDRDMWVTVDRGTARHTGPPRASHTAESKHRARPGRHTSLTEHGNGLTLGVVGSAHGGDRFPERAGPSPSSTCPCVSRSSEAVALASISGWAQRRHRRRWRSLPMESGLPQLRQVRTSGADLLYWRRKSEQWQQLAEGAPDAATAEYLHRYFEPTARAIDGLEQARPGSACSTKLSPWACANPRTNTDAKTAVAQAIHQTADHRSRLLAETDNSREVTWREWALNADDALKAAHAEIVAQRTRIGSSSDASATWKPNGRKMLFSGSPLRTPPSINACATQHRQPHSRRTTHSRPIQPALPRPSHRRP